MSNYSAISIFIAAIFALWFFSAPVQAQDTIAAAAGEPLTVMDVIVDKTDKNAVTARDQAIIEARRMAFQKLAERSMTPEAFKAYQMPDDKTIAALVQDFEIRNEQLSSNRYVANFTVRFSPEAADYIRRGGGEVNGASLQAQPPHQENKPPVTAASSSMPVSILVLPYFKDISGKNILWEDPNPWREAWQEFGNSTPSPGLTITVPLGDIADIAFGNSESVWAGDYSVVEKLRADYDANEVVLAVANKAGQSIQVDIYIYRNGRIYNKKSLPPYNVERDYKPVINQIISEIQELGKFAAQPEYAAEGDPASEDIRQPLNDAGSLPAEQAPQMQKIAIAAVMDFDSPMQWMEAQKRLASISPSLAVTISSLSKNSASFTITLEQAGGMAAFKEELAGRGLELSLPAVEVNPTGKNTYALRMN